jgi:signal transduction histidine kinase
LTNYVYRTGKPLLATPLVFQQLEQSGQIELIGRQPVDWLGVPLKTRQGTIGVMAVQTYTRTARLTEADQEVLTFVSTQAAMVIEHKRVEAERENLIEELEAKNAELERFTYTVSHDLKSPLITIRGFLGFLKKDAVSGNIERLTADIKRIGDAADRMQRLLNELLELSRVGRMMNPPVEVPFEAVVRDALELLHGRLAERPVRVEIVTPLPVVCGDRARLVEVMQNLVDNAIKFACDQPEPKIEIGVRTADPAGRPVFFVCDNGIGIEPQYHAKVFGLFDKLDPKSEGTGIGLALVKRIVEMHGGRVWVESPGHGRGSTFCFTLADPADQAEKLNRAQ